MNTKSILLGFFFLNTVASYAQTFKDYELKRLDSFEINQNSTNYLNLKTILEKDKKSRTNKTIGIVLTSLSALTMTFGAKIISSSRNDKEGLGQSIGSMFVAVGVIELGASIPLFISSKKRKRERNKLIEYYKSESVEKQLMPTDTKTD